MYGWVKKNSLSHIKENEVKTHYKPKHRWTSDCSHAKSKNRLFHRVAALRLVKVMTAIEKQIQIFVESVGRPYMTAPRESSPALNVFGKLRIPSKCGILSSNLILLLTTSLL